MDITMELRAICGHDSRSVDGCATCEGADLIETLRSENRRLRGGRVFAGWFTELRSGMSYRLWEQGGHDKQDNEVALYE